MIVAAGDFQSKSGTIVIGDFKAKSFMRDVVLCAKKKKIIMIHRNSGIETKEQARIYTLILRQDLTDDSAFDEQLTEVLFETLRSLGCTFISLHDTNGRMREWNDS